MKQRLLIGRISLWASAAVFYAATYCVLQYTAEPYRRLCLPMLLLLELLRAPIKLAVATFCMAAAQGRETPLFTYAFRRTPLQKALALQLSLWWMRLWRYALAFFPAAFLGAFSDRLQQLSNGSNYVSMVSFASLLLSFAVLFVGIALTEYSMLRYMAAWYVLTRCDGVTQALKTARSLSLYCMEDIATLCLGTCPCAFSVTRALWIEEKLCQSKHAYKFSENTKTVIGITDATIQF